MKPLFTFVILFVFEITVAQKLPSFGKIDKADLLSTDCSYDPGAEVEYLIDFAEVNYFFSASDFVNETKHRIRIKILKEKGLDVANVRLPFYKVGNRQSIGQIDGYTYNLDEKGEVVETKLERKSVLEQKINEQADMAVFTLPNVKVGSVIEYRYTHIKKNYFEIDDWFFQRQQPVRHSEYNVVLPSFLEFTYVVKRTLPLKEDNDAYSKVKSMIMNNVPGLDREPYMSCSKDYLQRVDFQLRAVNNNQILTTWPALTERLLEDDDFGAQIRKNVLKNLPLEEEIKLLKSNYHKMNAVYNFIKKNIAWDGNEGIWCKSGVKSALEKHSGNSAEINLLLVNLLKDAGLEAYPLLVSTRENGKINPMYPFIYQFNNVYALAIVDGTEYVLDGTTRYTPPFMMPWDVQFSDGYLVDKQNARFVSIQDTKHRYRISSSISAEVDESGKISGNATVMAYEYARSPRLSSLSKDKEKFITTHFSEPYPQFQFDSLVVKNEDNDSLPLQNSVRFKGQLNASGDYHFFSPNFLIEQEKNEFISEQRFTDIEFGYIQSYTIFGNIRFSDKLELEELPQNIKMILPDTSLILQRIMQKNDNSVSFRITLDIKRPTYYSDEYLYFKEFYSKLFEMLNEQLVFRKKAKP
jgi:hypothetical protein